MVWFHREENRMSYTTKGKLYVQIAKEGSKWKVALMRHDLATGYHTEESAVMCKTKELAAEIANNMKGLI